MINLADERDVGEEQQRAGKMQRLAGLGIIFAGITQPPARAVCAEHEREAGE